jgi:hypothetical protein
MAARNLRAGLTFAAKPKSTRQISPGSVLFILGFDNAPQDLAPCFVRQLRYF